MVNKHATNNKAHQCKTCRENFNSLSDVLEHDLKEHQDKQVKNKTSFVFSESMLDEFDLWRSQAGMVTADELVLVLGRLWDTLASRYFIFTRPIIFEIYIRWNKFLILNHSFNP